MHPYSSGGSITQRTPVRARSFLFLNHRIIRLG
ncbi:hypothetical protein F383_26055 [Gossypium arboreum]|uniref:Uncharacterized protein n=1 Tax=Gossypium arboreum TaxID=29729 RepID=A0A0B0P1B9_GOSAR|nr:hypothetical protein F383_26055 [Gossypium arboreum]